MPMMSPQTLAARGGFLYVSIESAIIKGVAKQIFLYGTVGRDNNIV